MRIDAAQAITVRYHVALVVSAEVAADMPRYKDMKSVYKIDRALIAAKKTDVFGNEGKGPLNIPIVTVRAKTSRDTIFEKDCPFAYADFGSDGITDDTQ